VKGPIAILLILLGAAMAHAEDLPDFRKLWNFQKPGETEQRFREILPQAEKAGDLGYLLELKTQIARTLGMQRKFDEAHAMLDDVAAALTDDTPVAFVRYLLERGRTLNSSKHPDQARPLFLAAWKVAQAVPADGLAVDAAHMMEIVEPTEKKADWNRKAMLLAERSDDPGARAWLGALYNNHAWNLHDQGKYEESLAVHRKGWEWQKGHGGPRGTRIAKWSVAKLLRMVGRVEEALALQRELLDEWKEAGEDDGFVFEELGECLLALGKEDEARPWFVKAWPLLKDQTWIKDSEPKRYARLAKLAGADEE